MAMKADVRVHERQHILGDDAEGSQRSLRDETLRRPRHIRSLSTIGGIFVNLLIAISPLYFIVFGLLVLKQNLQPFEHHLSQQLQQASIYGPTIFPVIYAAIVGKTLKSVADWKLERGTRIATLEYLLACRTVSGALIAPLRFRVVHFLILPLILLWSLSPLGSQASLRVISSTNLYHNTTEIITYLDINGSQPLISDAVDLNYWSNAITSTFNAALFSANSAKDAAQDPYGHVKIPMLEALSRSKAQNNGWLTIDPQDYDASIYSSMIGLPWAHTPVSDTATFSVETSYFSLNCSIEGGLVGQNSDTVNAWRAQDPFISGIAWNGDQMSLAYDRYHFNTTLAQPRNLTLWSLNSEEGVLSRALCQLTTTFVEAQISCVSGRCNATAVRPSTLSHANRNWSGIDLMGQLSPNFFNTFVNTSSKMHIGTSSPIEFYLQDPRDPIRPMDEVLLTGTDPVLFSQRFSQLLNSFWMITLTPTGALGQDFTIDMKTQVTSEKSAVANLQSSQLVLLCNKPWLVVLLISALMMVSAGILTTIMDASRRGPDILDLAVTLIRENAYAHIPHYSSLEGGSDQVRRLQKVNIRFGDVQPASATGYAAVAIPDDLLRVQALRRSRLYR